MKPPEALALSPQNASSYGFVQPALLIGLVVFCWWICTVAQLEKYLSLGRATVVCGIGCAGVALLMLLLRRSYGLGRDVSVWALVALFCVLVLSFAVLYPESQRHVVGIGSDREDALRVELFAVTHHRYPYDARTYLNHAPTPLPGAMLLAAPFYFAGRIALENLAWAALFFYFLTLFFCKRITALAFAFLFVLTALENLNDFDVGGDYMVNVMYVSIALWTFARAVSRPNTTWRTLLAVVFLGIALSSRILYLVTIPPMLALALQRTQPRRAWFLIGGVLLTAALVTLPVLSPHVLQHLQAQLNQNADKLRPLPPYLRGRALSLAAMALACSSFFLQMTLRRVFLLAGLSSLIMVLPPMALIVHLGGGFARPLTTDLEYFAVSAVFIALWVFARWEQTSIANTMPASRLSPV